MTFFTTGAELMESPLDEDGNSLDWPQVWHDGQVWRYRVGGILGWRRTEKEAEKAGWQARREWQRRVQRADVCRRRVRHEGEVRR